jgi:hypothetical protein
MAKQVQLRRGTTSEHSSFTGAIGEITVDTSLNTARVHDGSTAGGTRLARYSEIVTSSRQVVAGSGLSGGGTLSADVTLNIDTTVARLNEAQSYSAAQRGTVVTLTDGATITPDFSAGNNFALNIGGNRTLANPTNIAAGQSGVIVITNGGSHTLAFGSYWKFKDGTAPTITVSATDILAYYCDSTTRISAAVLANVS